MVLEIHLTIGQADGSDDVAGQVVGWHLISLLVDQLKVVVEHGLPKTSTSALVDFAQAGHRLVICIQKKGPTLQVVLKVLDSPKSTLHFKQKGCVAFLQIGEFST